MKVAPAEISSIVVHSNVLLLPGLHEKRDSLNNWSRLLSDASGS